MTTAETTTATPDEVHRAARALTPSIAARADEIEAGRRVPPDLLDALIRAGVFRIVRPASHGGTGADLAGAMRVFEALARADASVAWTVAIGSGSWCDLAGLPRPALDELLSEPDVITAGAFSPSGTIAADGDGYRATGRWGFASGCGHADWIYGNCVEAVVDGVPRLRIAVFAPDQIVIEDTWRVSGLRGTGSHHFRVDGAFVPGERTLDPMGDAPCIDAPIVRIPVPQLAALAFASVAVGCARGALDDVLAVAPDKVPLFAAGPLAADPTFQLALADADTELAAARALVYEAAAAAWETAAGSGEFSTRQRARIRAAAVWATERAAGVVRAAYRAGGGGSIYDASPLQRRLRDVEALGQHFLLRRDTMASAGAILAGQDIDAMVF